MTENNYSPRKYDDWIFLLKEMYEKNCKKYETKKYEPAYNPRDWYK